MVHQPPPPSGVQKQRKTLIIVAAVAAAVLFVCVLGVVVSRLGKTDDTSQDGTQNVTASPSVEQEDKDKDKPAQEPVATIPMPDLVGKNAAIAKDELERLGFTDIELGSADPNDTLVIIAANWTVVEQSHEPDERVPSDALIVLTCSKKK